MEIRWRGKNRLVSHMSLKAFLKAFFLHKGCSSLLRFGIQNMYPQKWPLLNSSYSFTILKKPCKLLWNPIKRNQPKKAKKSCYIILFGSHDSWLFCYISGSFGHFLAGKCTDFFTTLLPKLAFDGYRSSMTEAIG